MFFKVIREYTPHNITQHNINVHARTQGQEGIIIGNISSTMFLPLEYKFQPVDIDLKVAPHNFPH